jgi:hypothetical protein
MLGSWRETYGEDYTHPGGKEPQRYPQAITYEPETTATQRRNLRPGGGMTIRAVGPSARETANDKMRRGEWKVEEVD